MPNVLTPVVDPKTGEVILYDIWVAGAWVGSRRTLAHAIDRLRWLGWPSAVLATHYRIEYGVNCHRIIFDADDPGTSEIEVS